MKTKCLTSKHIILLVLIILVLVSVTAVNAFLISKDSFSNRFIVGNNTSHIEEIFGSYDSFTKGQNYKKNVTVKNDGNVPCYVRVFAEIEDPEIAANVGINFNTADWTGKQSDGYYYYKKSLKTGESTTPLFTTLSAKSDIKNFQMICYEETVQTDGAADPISAFNN